jgi:hypothetical protein
LAREFRERNRQHPISLRETVPCNAACSLLLTR